jgi:DNA-binding response OmpR family regulator
VATILIVDDERVLCDLLKMVLESYGHEVLTAYNGREGLNLFAQHRPQFTLLDLRMPEMEGLEVLRQIRTTDPQAAVMILTAWGSDALEKQARQLGVTDFLSKTLALDTILVSMERFLPPTTQVVEILKEKRAPSKVLETDRILLIGSNTDVSRSLKQFLIQRGFYIQVARDGPAALQLVAKEMPRLIVLDMDLQGMEGLEVMRELRAKQYSGGIIMLSNTADETLLDLALDMRSVDVLGKPVDPERLAVAIQVSMLLTEEAVYRLQGRMKAASEIAEERLKCPNGHPGQLTPMQMQPSEGASHPQPGWMCQVCGATVMRCICGWPLYRDPSTLIFEDCRNPDCFLAKKTLPTARKKKRGAPRRPPRR